MKKALAEKKYFLKTGKILYFHRNLQPLENKSEFATLGVKAKSNAEYVGEKEGRIAAALDPPPFQFFTGNNGNPGSGVTPGSTPMQKGVNIIQERVKNNPPPFRITINSSPAIQAYAPSRDLRYDPNKPVQREEDTRRGAFANKDDQVKTISGNRDVNAPVFNAETMRDVLAGSEFRGAGSKELAQAMKVLYKNPQGEALDEALATVARIRGLDPKDMQRQYSLAMKIKLEGEVHALREAIKKGEVGDYLKEGGVSPSFSDADLAEGGRHHGFTGSKGQLRFGMILGDVFGIDPVFGSLISPTGGAVGPGTESVSNADPNNPTVLHGVAHDAAGYLLNAHGIGPGYNYLNKPYEVLGKENPISGQVSGTSYFADRNPGLNTLATLATLVSNIPRFGLDFEKNVLHSSIETGGGNIYSRSADQVQGLASDAWKGISDIYDKIPKADKVKQDYGSRPEGNGLAGPYAYLNTARGDKGATTGWTGGAGVGSYSHGDSNASLLSGSFHLGKTPDENGGSRYGLGANVGGVKGKYNIPQLIDGMFGKGTSPKGLIGELEAGVGTASADAWLNPDSGFSLGAQANIGEIAATLGTTGTSNRDSTGRIGLSEGVGLALRGHWGDSDKDNQREYGFGFDYGPLSVDLKSEDPLRDFVLSSMTGIGPLAANLVAPDKNLTNEAADAISGLASDAWKGAKNIGGKAKKLGSKAWSKAKSLGRKVKGLAGDAWKGAKNLGKKFMSGASALGHKVSGLASDAWSGAKNIGNQALKGIKNLGSKVSGLAGDAWTGAKNLGSKAWSGVKNVGSQAWEGAKNVGGKVAGLASTAWDSITSLF